MKSYITIEEFYTFKLVKYYTVKVEGQESETDKFISKHEESEDLSIKENFEVLMAWLEVIGEETTLKNKDLIRFEEKAGAFPPIRKVMKSRGMEVEGLRLYCFKVSDSICILFNGGYKPKNKRSVQDCPDLLPHFRMANKLSKLILKAISEGDIKIRNKNLIFSTDFYLEY